MKYDTLLTEVNQILPSAQNVLVILPAEPSVDDLAAGLALFLALQEVNKAVSVVTQGVIRVGHGHLFGVGEIQTGIPPVAGGNLVISLGGVVVPNESGQGDVPSLEELNWHPKGNDLELVFKVKSGHKFEPTHITPRYEGGGFNLIFVIGASSLPELGAVYNTHSQLFSQTHLVNIDNNSANANFGKTNVVDSQASSVSEIVAQVIPGLGLPFEQDIASNILAGLFAATSSLQNGNITADTYAVVSAAMRAGGQKPTANMEATAPVSPAPAAASISFTPQPPSGQASQPAVVDQKIFQDVFNLKPIQQPASTGSVEQVTAPSTSVPEPEPQPQPSPEEAPSGEMAVTPEEDWLTPKIFKGSSLG